MVKTKRKKVADIALIKKLREEADVSIHRIENDLKIGKSIVLRGLRENSDRPLPPKWETPIIKYLKKKIAEKVDIELQTQEIKLEMGFSVPEPESDLKEDLKEQKRTWVDGLQ